MADLVHSPVRMEVVVRRPIGFARWRWLLCFHLIKIAARIYPFKVQFYREPEIGDFTNHPMP